VATRYPCWSLADMPSCTQTRALAPGGQKFSKRGTWRPVLDETSGARCMLFVGTADRRGSWPLHLCTRRLLAELAGAALDAGARGRAHARHAPYPNLGGRQRSHLQPAIAAGSRPGRPAGYRRARWASPS
jgi:hypothetical protein